MDDLDPLILARMQFAFTVSFHIIFPTISIGLALFLVIVEALWLRTGDLVYRQIYRFWLNIFAMSFAIGVVTGIVLSFEFGLTFAKFAQLAGPVIGPLIGLEVLTSFFLEAGFLGIMLFGESRVGPNSMIPRNPASRKDRKSTRLNSSHDQISYAVFCLK